MHDTQSTTWDDPRAGQPEAPETHQRPFLADGPWELIGFVWSTYTGPMGFVNRLAGY